jgi:hypothetical protein
MITVSLYWWLLPLALAIAGVAIPASLKSQGDYDFGTPLIGFAIFAACEMGAVGLLVGRWLA